MKRNFTGSFKCGTTFSQLILFALFLLPLFAESGGSGRITVLVKDASNSVVSGAQVDVQSHGKHVKDTTDENGSFSLEQAPFGSYKVTVHAPGFSPAEADFDLTASQSIQRVSLTLRIMEHLEQVEVESAPKADFSRGLGAQVLGSQEIALLPDDPDQLRSRLQMLATASGGSSGNVPVQVDGFLTDSSIPSKSAIREIRINPDLYSAQYSNQPIFGGGLIEIDTKPGSGCGSRWFRLDLE